MRHVQDQDGFNGYFGEMPWLALPFADRACKDALSTQFGVQGIPTLVVLDETGATVTTNGRAEVGKYLGGGGGGGGGGCSIL